MYIDMYIFGDVCLYPLRLLRNFYMHVFFRIIGDLMSISCIFVLFACFIALIEIGRYKLVSEPWSVLSGLEFNKISCLYTNGIELPLVLVLL